MHVLNNYTHLQTIACIQNQCKAKLELTFRAWIFDPASVTVFPALLTAEYKKLPKDLAPARALLCTKIKLIYVKTNCIIKPDWKK